VNYMWWSLLLSEQLRIAKTNELVDFRKTKSNKQTLAIIAKNKSKQTE